MTRIAVVTGAAGGMGRAISDRLIEDGLQVVGVDIDGPALLAMAADRDRFHPEICDLTDADAIADLFDRITDRFGGVDREIRVVLDPARMQALGVTASQINAALRQVNINAAGGKTEVAGSRQSVRVLGNARTAYDLSQTEIALSSTEAEFIALATATRAAIPIQHILVEMKELGFPVITDQNTIHCSVFEDNSGALAIAKLPKTRPRTKHINAKYFQFLHHTQGEGAPYSFHHIGTDEQPADMLTKPLPPPKLFKHRQWLLGW